MKKLALVPILAAMLMLPACAALAPFAVSTVTSPPALQAEATAVTTQALAAYPDKAPLVQSIAAGIHTLSTVNAPDPVSFRATLLSHTAGIPALVSIANAVADKYAANFPTITKAASALPYIEALAAGVEAAAKKATPGT